MNRKSSPAVKPAENTSLAIPPAEYPDLHALAAQIQEEVRQISAPSSERPSESANAQSVEIVPAAIARALTTIATNAWKLKLKMTQSESGDIKEEFKRLYRHVESILDSFADIGMEIKDRTGQIFDYGLPEKVVATQPKTGISKKLVIETVKPTIYFNGQILQCGEVIIATPEESSPRPGDPS